MMPGMSGTMDEFKEGTLHSGSKQGPKVTSRRQAVAIGLSEERKAGKKVPPKPGSKEHRKKHMSEAIKKAHQEYRSQFGGGRDTEGENPFNSHNPR